MEGTYPDPAIEIAALMHSARMRRRASLAEALGRLPKDASVEIYLEGPISCIVQILPVVHGGYRIRTGSIDLCAPQTASPTVESWSLEMDETNDRVLRLHAGGCRVDMDIEHIAAIGMGGCQTVWRRS